MLHIRFESYLYASEPAFLLFGTTVSLVRGKRLNKEWPWTDRGKVYLVRMADEETWDGLSEERTAWQVQNTRVTIKTTRKEFDVEPQILPRGEWDTASRQHVEKCCPS